MKKISLIYPILYFALVAIFIFDCTENPFYNDNNISGDRIISGKVALSDQSSPDDVFVWLEDFDVHSRTDKNGYFQILLPSQEKQTGGGLNGIFNLYFYVANYALDSAEVVIQNGAVVRSDGDLNDKGELRETKHLSKLLNIKVMVSPETVSENSSDSIYVMVALQAVHDSIEVVIPKMNRDIPKGRPDLLSAIFFKKIDSVENIVKLINNGGDVQRTYTVATTTLQWRLNLEQTPGFFPPGDYQIIPYILIQQKNLPAGLMESLGENVEDFSPNYVNIPLKVEGGKIGVEGSN